MSNKPTTKEQLVSDLRDYVQWITEGYEKETVKRPEWIETVPLVNYRIIADLIDELCVDKNEVDIPELPEGIEWPRFEDGELIKFPPNAGAFVANDGNPCPLTSIAFDIGGTITLNYSAFDEGERLLIKSGERIKRPTPPDTQEAIDKDALMSPYEYAIERLSSNSAPKSTRRIDMIGDLLCRQRELDARLMGGDAS